MLGMFDRYVCQFVDLSTAHIRGFVAPGATSLLVPRRATHRGARPLVAKSVKLRRP